MFNDSDDYYHDVEELIAEDEAMLARGFQEPPSDFQTNAAAAHDVEEHSEYNYADDESEDDSVKASAPHRRGQKRARRVIREDSDEDESASVAGSDANVDIGSDTSSVPAVESVADKLLYADNECDYATAEQEARQLGRDAPWVKEVKRKRDEMMKALAQVEDANSHTVVLGLEWDASNQQRESAARRLSKILVWRFTWLPRKRRSTSRVARSR